MSDTQGPSAPAGQPIVFPLHAGARGAFVVVGVLLILLVITIPFAIWVFITSSRSRLEIIGTRLLRRSFFTSTWNLTSVRRLGVLAVPVIARGVGGVLARRKVGGDHAIHLCAIDDRGKKMNMLISTFERHQEIVERVAGIVRVPVEQVKTGLLGPKWPE